MRLELQTIAYIEQYLLDVLTDPEKQVFEERMAADPDFKNEVDLQKQLVQGLERISLQQTIQKAQQTYTFWKLWKLIGMIVISILLLLTAWYFINILNKTASEAETIPTKVEQEIYEGNTEEVISIPDTIPKKKTSIITPTETTVYAKNIVVDPLEKIQSEIFTIITEKDTILETKNGIVFLIPENAFVDANQNIVNGNVEIEIKEAIDSYTIMTTGLSTLFNDKPLETGGMFFMEATKDGQKLLINPQKEIIADIPTQNYKEGMQLFDGEKTEDGTINWTNPKPLNTALIPQDIYSLNFYPPNYLKTLTEKGYNTTDKKFTDSLYYSFGYIDSKIEKKYQTIGKYLEEKINKKQIRIQDTQKVDAVFVQSKDSVKSNTPTKNRRSGLDPLKVKTIWNKRYQNTFIATKAFEERLQIIHKNCGANFIFDIYMENLDRNLYEVDSIVAYFPSESDERRKLFEPFIKQRLTNVANIDSDVAKLNTYYIQQQKVYRLALEKSQRKIDSLISVDKKYQAFSKQQLQNYYLNELAITTDKVAKDLGARLPRSFNQTRNNQTQNNRANIRANSVSNKTSNNVTSIANIIKKEKRKRRYRAPIRTTGWKNIDRIINEEVISSVKSRITTTIKNREKSVTISYSNYEVSIENTERFDKLFVYLVPTNFNNFVRLSAENGHFTYKLNDLLKYRVHCIAYVNDIPFYIDKTIRNASDKVKLRQITAETLREHLSKINNQNNSLETEVLYQASRKMNQTKLKKYREVIKLKKEIKNVIFPCKKYDIIDKILNDALEAETTELVLSESIDFKEKTDKIPFELVESVPIYPGCENLDTKTARKKCMSEKIQKIINSKTNTDILSKHEKLSGPYRISASFVIDTSGVVNNIRIRANHPEAEAEIRRVLHLIPKMKPASQKGRTVSVKYTIPIVFRVDN